MNPPPSQGAVRRARAADAPRIAALYATLVANPALDVRAECVAELATDSRAALFVHEDPQGLVDGTVLVVLCADVMFGRRPFAVVENIVVDPEARGRGTGARLLLEVERFCAGHDCTKIMLLSAAHRTDAHVFFERCGFAGSSKRGFVKYRRDFLAAPMAAV